MGKRRVIALGLAFASFLLALAFGILTAVCGAMQASPGSGPSCASAFHPLAPVWAAFAVLGMASLWWWRAWPVVVLGSLGLALGVVSGFSAGLYGIGCGALLLAAGLVAGGGRGRQQIGGGPTGGPSSPGSGEE